MSGQAEFTHAVLTPEADVPSGLTDGRNGPAGKRFDVYRNNVAVSLTEALETAFPVVRRLVGDANFKILAGAFLRKHPPSSPLLMLYGADLAVFLESFPPTQSIRYLPDIARLEQALRESYHAGDAKPIDQDRLSAIPPEDLAGIRLTLAPSLRVLRSSWPVHAIWTYNTKEGSPKPVMQAEEVAIIRAEFDPEPVLLTPGDADFIDAILAGKTLGDALSAAAETNQSFDLSLLLTTLITRHAIVDIGAPRP